MATKSKEVFEEDIKMTLVLDTGYYNKSQIVESLDENTEILIKKQKGKKEKLEAGFDKANFKYDKVKDIYICPKGYELEFKWKDNTENVKRYVCKNYGECGKKDLCTKAKQGRVVTRYIHEETIELVEENTIVKNEIYKKRGSIVEHPFGTIKRHYGYSYFLRRGLDSVNAEGGLICLVYNIKRLINIVGVRKLVAHFRAVTVSKTDIVINCSS